VSLSFSRAEGLCTEQTVTLTVATGQQLLEPHVREQRVDALRRIAEECLAGRLVTRARLCKQVKNSLELLEWRKESVKIRPVKLPDGEEEPDKI
jgi:hypothetical protein